jgi:hypothetical protein
MDTISARGMDPVASPYENCGDLAQQRRKFDICKRLHLVVGIVSQKASQTLGNAGGKATGCGLLRIRVHVESPFRCLLIALITPRSAAASISLTFKP